MQTTPAETTEPIYHLPLARLRPNPHNPRKRFSGRKFEDLVASIQAQGVLQPIMVRPMKDGDITHEVIFGGRRFAASRMAAESNGGMDAATIPAIVRELDDDTALDLMTIENLQRDDLTPIEEAHGFKSYVDRHPDPDAAVLEMAKQTGIRTQYIRRRLALFKLPAKIIKAWEKGDISYSHLRQFLRIHKDKKLLAEMFEAVGQWRWNAQRVEQRIDGLTPPLKWAKFDMDKTGCDTCPHNSDVQREQMGIDGEKGRCLNRVCFKKHQNNHLLKNWKRSGYRRKHKTTGFRFYDDIERIQNRYISWTSAKKCHECEHYVTLFELDGKAREPYACIGERECFEASSRSGGKKTPAGGQASGKGAEAKPDPAKDPAAYLKTPRVSWHGEHFREEFYKEEIPRQFKCMAHGDLQINHLTLYALIEISDAAFSAFARRFDLLDKSGNPLESWQVKTEKIEEIIFSLPRIKTAGAIMAVTQAAVLSGAFASTQRRQMATHIGIDLNERWRLNEDYLQKKTKAELMALGKHLGIFETQEANIFLYEKLLKKRGRFDTCRKPELIRVFLESGVNLAGKVPPEILAK